MSSENDPSEDTFSAYLLKFTNSLQEIHNSLNEEQLDLESSEITEKIESELFIEKLEDQIYNWMGSFYNIIIYLLINIMAFLIALVDPSYNWVALSLLFLFPPYSWGIFIFSIPTIRIDNKVVFSRKNLGIRQQIRLARMSVKFFLEQMYYTNKKGIFILGVSIITFAIILLQNI